MGAISPNLKLSSLVLWSWARDSIPEDKRKAYTHSCFATSAKCTGNHDLFLLQNAKYITFPFYLLKIVLSCFYRQATDNRPTFLLTGGHAFSLPFFVQSPQIPESENAKFKHSKILCPKICTVENVGALLSI